MFQKCEELLKGTEQILKPQPSVGHCGSLMGRVSGHVVEVKFIHTKNQEPLTSRVFAVPSTATASIEGSHICTSLHHMWNTGRTAYDSVTIDSWCFK